MAIAWEGVTRLAHEYMPPKSIKLSWAIAVEKQRLRYERYCRTAAELSSLYAEHGIAMVQLKGVGLSSYYPVPSHREGGDIDIYTYSADKSRLTDKEANTLADRLMEEAGIEVEYHTCKHSNFYYKAIPIENHKSFLNIDTIDIARVIDATLHEIISPSEIELCDGKYKIHVPSPEFNTLFLSFHAAQHYCSGIRLHHLYDWACLLKRHGLNIHKNIKDTKYLNFIHSLTALCNELLGTDTAVTYNEQTAATVYDQIMHWKYDIDNAPKNKIAVFFFKTGRFLTSFRKNSILYDQSLIKVIWRSLIFHLKNPRLLFTD